MIEPERFKQVVKQSFSFLVTEHEMKFEKEVIQGNSFYDLTYSNDHRAISVSLENVENYFLVILFKLKGGQLPNFDDKTRTIHLSELTKSILTKIDNKDFVENNEFFQEIDVHGSTENLILKSAKELRLCLKYIEP